MIPHDGHSPLRSSRCSAAKPQQIALNFQDRDVVGRDLDDFIFAFESTAANPRGRSREVSIPESPGGRRDTTQVSPVSYVS